jgi:hypothetical protein
VQVDPIQNVRIEGRVHLLTKKQAGGAGVVGLDDGKRKYRVHLTSDADYHRAVKAHDEDRRVAVVGRLERQGNLTYLYSANLLAVLSPLVLPVVAIDEPNLFGDDR